MATACALLHDIGELGASNSILDKNGKLDDAEWQEMHRHAILSERGARRDLQEEGPDWWWPP